jgi:hypothetical protein
VKSARGTVLFQCVLRKDFRFKKGATEKVMSTQQTRPRSRWVVYYYWKARWRKDAEFSSKYDAANYGYRVFGSSFLCPWKIQRRVKQGRVLWTPYVEKQGHKYFSPSN